MIDEAYAQEQRKKETEKKVPQPKPLANPIDRKCTATILLLEGASKEDMNWKAYTSKGGERKKKRNWTLSSHDTQRWQRISFSAKRSRGAADKLEKAMQLIHTRAHRGKMTIPISATAAPGGTVALNSDEVKTRRRNIPREFRDVRLLQARQRNKENDDTKATEALLKDLDYIDELFFDCVHRGINLYHNTDPLCTCPFCSCRIELQATQTDRKYADGQHWPMFLNVSVNPPKMHMSCNTPTLAPGIMELKSKVPASMQEMMDQQEQQNQDDANHIQDQQNKGRKK